MTVSDTTDINGAQTFYLWKPVDRESIAKHLDIICKWTRIFWSCMLFPSFMHQNTIQNTIFAYDIKVSNTHLFTVIDFSHSARCVNETDWATGGGWWILGICAALQVTSRALCWDGRSLAPALICIHLVQAGRMDVLSHANDNKDLKVLRSDHCRHFRANIYELLVQNLCIHTQVREGEWVKHWPNWSWDNHFSWFCLHILQTIR